MKVKVVWLSADSVNVLMLSLLLTLTISLWNVSCKFSSINNDGTAYMFFSVNVINLWCFFQQLMKELETERERRWKAEQASKKLLNHIQALQGKGNTTKETTEITFKHYSAKVIEQRNYWTICTHIAGQRLELKSFYFVLLKGQVYNFLNIAFLLIWSLR